MQRVRCAVWDCRALCRVCAALLAVVCGVTRLRRRPAAVIPFWCVSRRPVALPWQWPALNTARVCAAGEVVVTRTVPCHDSGVWVERPLRAAVSRGRGCRVLAAVSSGAETDSRPIPFISGAPRTWQLSCACTDTRKRSVSFFFSICVCIHTNLINPFH